MTSLPALNVNQAPRSSFLFSAVAVTPHTTPPIPNACYYVLRGHLKNEEERIFRIPKGSRMQFVEIFQFFLELSNCRIWILAICRKKVSDTGNLANYFRITSATVNLSNPAAVNLSNPATVNVSTHSFIFLSRFLKVIWGGVGEGVCLPFF